ATVQYFERGVLRLGPDQTASLAPLPRSLVPGPFPPQQPSGASDQVQLFPETGQMVGFALLDFYQRHGGRDTFGLPLSPQIGNVQWFERARLDWDPAGQQVSLAPLGGEILRAAGLDPTAFQTQWVATFEETSLFAEPTTDSSGPSVPQFRPFLAVGSQGDYLKVWDPTRNAYGWLPSAVVGPAAAPPWLSGLASSEYVGEPGRIAKPIFGQFPDPAPELQHNAPAWIVARVGATDGSTYYLDDNGNAIPEQVVRLPRTPPSYHAGRWIDADLTEPVLITAYEDDRPVYSALAVKGTSRGPTQVGSFQIWRRVANETMSSATIGIPLGTPGSYYLT